jgi:hypothetical protein
MNVTLIALAVALSLVVGGCSVHGPEIRVKPEGSQSGGGGGFCPPGQAKKGNC